MCARAGDDDIWMQVRQVIDVQPSNTEHKDPSLGQIRPRNVGGEVESIALMKQLDELRSSNAALQRQTVQKERELHQAVAANQTLTVCIPEQSLPAVR
jgi:hypothetical protein